MVDGHDLEVHSLYAVNRLHVREYKDVQLGLLLRALGEREGLTFLECADTRQRRGTG